MLDIIIPTYKNKEGLRRTLKSIDSSLLEQIKVTIIDDCSNLTYEDIIEKYPFVNFLYNSTNIGPGMTRQYGIENTNNPYITFIDTGDIFISNEAQQHIFKILSQYPNHCVYSWHFKLDDKVNRWIDNHLHGRIYSRKFLQDYHISFCAKGSRANEDVGFNRSCRIILKQFNLPIVRIEEPALVEWIREENSLTRKNNNEFSYKAQNMGLAVNTENTIKICKLNNIDNQTILGEINIIMANMFYGVLCAMQERPEFIQEAWDGARYFYFNVFLPEPHVEDYTDEMYSKVLPKIMKRRKIWKHNITLNYKRFLMDIKLFEQPPSSYIL